MGFGRIIYVMNQQGECFYADVGDLRLFAYISQIYGCWSAAIYDRKQEKLVWQQEPLMAHDDDIDSAKREASYRVGVQPDSIGWSPTTDNVPKAKSE